MQKRRLLLTLILILTTSPAWPWAQRLRAGHQATFIAPPSGTFGSALAVHPGSPEIVYAAIGGTFGSEQGIYEIDLSGGLASPVFTLLANGALDTSQYDGANPNFILGDNVLDSLFASVGGIAALPTGELVIVDNNERAFASPNPIPGDTIHIARDLNSDGDFLDVVDVTGTPTPEVQELLVSIPGAPPGSGFGGFSGVQAEIGPDGAVYVITADGFDAGEVIRIADPAGAATATLYHSGIDYGAGLAWIADTLWVTEVDDSFGFARLWALEDINDSDAIESGEDLLISSALPGASDITATSDGQLMLSTFGELLQLGVAAGATEGRMVPGLGLFLGDVAGDGSAASFAPHSGPGAQRVYAVGNNFSDASRLIVFEPAAATHATLQEPFHYLSSLSPPDAALGWGSEIAAASATPETILTTLGSAFNTGHEVWSVDLTERDYPVHQRLIGGALDVSQYDGVNPNFIDGDDLLDSRFGSVGGLVALSTGEMIVVDNSDQSFASPNAIPGDTIFIARDLNGDGDFLDVVAASPEVEALLTSIPGAPGGSGFLGFSGIQAEVGPDGAVYVITADGFDGGEVLRIADPAGSASPGVFWEDGADGVDYGAGLAWLGDSLFAADVDDGFGFARLRELTDNAPADGDALDTGEMTLVTDTLPASTDLAAGPAGSLWQTREFAPASALLEIDSATGATARTLATATQAFGGLAFTSTAGPAFVPALGNTDALVTQSTDFAGTTFLHVITTNPTVPVELSLFGTE